MIFDEIVLHNFGVFRGRQTIKLTPPSKEKPVVLIGGLNGGGKTTLLDAFQLALYGKNAHCSNRGNTAYETFLKNCINRSVPLKDGAAIELQFQHTSGGKQNTYRIHRSWFQNGKSIKEKIEVLHNGIFDRVLTDGWNEYVEAFIPSDISHLFFFDGEKIEKLANKQKNSQLLTTAVQSLLGLNLVDRLMTDLTVLERRKRSTLKNAKDIEVNEQMNKLEIEAAQLEKQHEELAQKRASLQNELDKVEKRLKKADLQYRQEGGKLYEKRAELDAEKAATEKALSETKTQFLEIVSGPAPLLLVKELLDKVCKQAQLEASAKQAALIEDFLIKRDKALIKKIKNANQPKEVIKIIQHFLSSDRNSRGKTAKVDTYLNLSENAETQLSTLNTVLKETGKNIKKNISKFNELKSYLDVIDRKIANIPSKDNIDALRKTLDEARADHKALNYKIKHIDDESERIINHLSQKKVSLSKLLESKIASEYDKDAIQRTITHSLKVRKTLGKYRSEIIRYNIHHLEQLILDCFKQLLWKKTLLEKLEINPETFEVSLYASDGCALQPERLSAGERQLFAASILWGLARASGRPLPTIIDTPLGRLDSSHRTHLVKRYFPFASHQILLLSTDEEINERYYKEIKRWVGKSYSLDFDDSVGCTQVKKGYFW
jgi:DNA sulfur modification protein DndD